MANTAKRGRPAKAAEPAIIAEKKVDLSKFDNGIKIPSEYEIIGRAGIVYMLNRSEVMHFDKKTKKQVSLRYCPNEPSIMKDEQNDSSPKGSVVFREGRLFVGEQNQNLKKFLDLHPDNQVNGGSIFRRVDHAELAKKELAADFLYADAVNLVRNKSIDEIMSVATAFAINTDRMVDEVRHDLLVFAKKNPKSFIEAFDNPVIETKAKVKKAMKYNLISHKGGHIVWTDTNKHIIAVPEGKDPADIFVRYCMTETGSVVLNEIERQLT
jgi:cation diffusion facilitator CzcD-associated flavoprotein CzcO